MWDLARSLLVAGLMSGTQPVTIMGLLLLRTGNNGARNSFAFLAGAFTIETTLLVLANLVVGGEVKPDSAPGTVMLILRILLGVGLLVVGLLLRRPAKEEAPEIPKALQRLRDLTLFKAFVAGVLLADYVGPVMASLAITTSTASLGGRFVAIMFYTLLATGIPATFLILSLTSKPTGERLDKLMSWVMKNRRRLASWITLVLGTLLVADGVVGVIVVQNA